MTDVKFSSKPEREIIYQVGDRVEVYCDHEKDGERTRGWLAGVVVQADAKMVAVQFKESVYLTDGWMVPDHVLWSTQKSSTIRYIQTRRRRPRPMKKDD